MGVGSFFKEVIEMKERQKGKHLTWNERLIFEKLLIKDYSIKECANIIGCSKFTLYKERKRASYVHTNSDLTEEVRYCPDIAQANYDKNLRAKGKTAKLENSSNVKTFIRNKLVNDKYSPAAIEKELSLQDSNKMEFTVCKNTIYNAIKKGLFDDVTMAELPAPRRKIKRKKISVQKQCIKGTSIERRDDDILNRTDFGNWEMDCVVGKSSNKKTLLVLTERKTRMEIIEELKYHNANEVRKAINRIEKRFGSNFYKVFKTITVDNGVEFSDYKSIEKALYRVGKRTEVYYCHPYCPSERGTNEVNNKLIRRWLPKGSNFDIVVNKKKIKKIQEWMNDYPRKIFNGNSSCAMYKRELSALGITELLI